MTETCAGLTFQRFYDHRHGVAGVPIPTCEVKVVSCPDIVDKAGQPYLSTDRLDVEGEPVFGRGEVMVKGNNMSSGYYMMPEATKEAFEADGWFHTGTSSPLSWMVHTARNMVDESSVMVASERVAQKNLDMFFGTAGKVLSW